MHLTWSRHQKHGIWLRLPSVLTEYGVRRFCLFYHELDTLKKRIKSSLQSVKAVPDMHSGYTDFQATPQL